MATDPTGFDRDIYLNVSVLFAARDSVYKRFPGLDVWDEERDALNWPGGNPAVFHPPCRLFCMLRKFSTAPEAEKELAYWSVGQVRKWGGVLEHPAHSTLWEDCNLPKPGKWDGYGFTYGTDQWWFGNPGRKRTWIYVCDLAPKELPDVPFKLGEAPGGSWLNNFGHKNPLFNDRETRHLRSATPESFAKWLIQTAELCHV